MNQDDLILLGLKGRVMALSRSTGREVWSTRIPSGMCKADFLTMVVHDQQVFVYGRGHISALNLLTGEVLWTNELPGMGYDLGSLAIPDGPSAPDMATIQLMKEQAAAKAHAGGSHQASHAASHG
jgi:outer membrane protein assembly factor BamB